MSVFEISYMLNSFSNFLNLALTLNHTRLGPVQSADDETFVIDDEVYKAKTRCHNFADTGDRVSFVKGNPKSCVSATLYNPRNEKLCDVRCK